MPRNNYYISDNERELVIEWLLTQNSKIVPSMIYDSKNYTLLENKYQLQNYLNNTIIRFFILNKYTVEPLLFGDLGNGKYIIHQRNGGPYIDIAFYLGFDNDSEFPYKCTIIDHYNKFIHFNSHYEFLVPNELKSFYKEINKCLKGICKIKEYNGKKYWVGKEAIEEMERDGRL